MKDVRRPGTWHRKVHPVFLEMAAANREFEEWLRGWLGRWADAQKALGPKAPAARYEALLTPLLDERDATLARFEARLDRVVERHGDPPPQSGAFAYLTPASGERSLDPEPGPLFRLLHWLRHGKTVESTAAEDSQGNLDAYAALTRTGEDVRRVVFAQGPLAPFKRDEDHRRLFELLSCYESEPLTEYELAECFDEFCPCGQVHGADALRKQYARLKHDLKAAQQNRQTE